MVDARADIIEDAAGNQICIEIGDYDYDSQMNSLRLVCRNASKVTKFEIELNTREAMEFVMMLMSTAVEGYDS